MFLGHFLLLFFDQKNFWDILWLLLFDQSIFRTFFVALFSLTNPPTNVGGMDRWFYGGMSNDLTWND
jgi:hypothetical protein